MSTQPTNSRDLDQRAVTEHALIDVVPGQELSFEETFSRARRHLDSSPGCRSARLLRGVESPSRYMLLVEWEHLDDHLVGFRQSPAFSAWREEVGPYFASPPQVDHFSSTSAASATLDQ